MNREVLVDEQVDALVRVMPTGEIRPTSFLWRNKTRYVGDIGRTWEERVDGRTLRCYMVQSVDRNTFSCGVVPPETATTGVAAERWRAISSVAMIAIWAHPM